MTWVTPSTFSVGQILTSTAMNNISGDLSYLRANEIAYDWITSGIAVIGTTEGAATTIISGTSHTYENITYLIHFFAPGVVLPSTTGGTLNVILIEDGSNIGRIGLFENDVTGGQSGAPGVCEYRFKPTAGAHTYGVSAYVSATTGSPTIQAGAGGASTAVPAFLRVTIA